MAEPEEPLAGGFVTAVVRVGATVRRARSSAFAHRLLAHFAACDWPGAPRLLGVDERGREVLGFVEGAAAWRPEQQARLRTDANLRRVGQLLREGHDLTAGTALAGDQEVVCHNDLSPRNTIYQDGTPVAFVDWDLAAPGARVHDVAHACWQFADLGQATTDVAEAARLIDLVCAGYGLADRSALVDTIGWWQDRCWRGIEAGAAAGEPAMVRLRDGGGAASVRVAADWLAAHRDRLHHLVTHHQTP